MMLFGGALLVSVPWQVIEQPSCGSVFGGGCDELPSIDETHADATRQTTTLVPLMLRTLHSSRARVLRTICTAPSRDYETRDVGVPNLRECTNLTASHEPQHVDLLEPRSARGSLAWS